MRSSSGDGIGCGCILVVLIINLLIGGVCFDYVLDATLGVNVPWYADAVCGLFLGEVIIPAAIVCWVLTLAGVPTPFFNV